MNDQEHRARLLDVMPDAVFINTGGRVVSCNPAMLELFGAKSAAELLDKPVFSLFHPRYHDVIRRRIDLMLQTRAAVPMIEEELIHLHDGLVPVEVIAASCVHDEQPSVVVVLRDLRRRHDLEARFRLLLESVTDYAIFTTDAEGRITTWNDGARRLSGFTAADAMGQPHSRLFTAEDVAARAPQRALEAALASEQSVEAWRARKDGSRFWANTVITARRDSNGRPLGFVQVVRDLSERQASEAALSSSEGRHRELFECISDPLFVYDRETLG